MRAPRERRTNHYLHRDAAQSPWHLRHHPRTTKCTAAKRKAVDRSLCLYRRLRREQEQRAAKFAVLHSTFAKKEAGLRELAEHAEVEAAAARAQAVELASEVAAAQRCVQACSR